MATRMVKHNEKEGYRYEELDEHAKDVVRQANAQANWEYGWDWWDSEIDFLIDLLEVQIGGVTVRHNKNDWVDGKLVRKDPDIAFEIGNYRGTDGAWFSADFDLPEFFEGMVKAEGWMSTNANFDLNEVGAAMLTKHAWIIAENDGRAVVSVRQSHSNWSGYSMDVDSDLEYYLSLKADDMEADIVLKWEDMEQFAYYDTQKQAEDEIGRVVVPYRTRVEKAIEELHDDILSIAQDFASALYKWLEAETEYWGSDEYAKDIAAANDHWYDEDGEYLWDYVPQEEVSDDEEE